METYVALLRGINVGGNNKLNMDGLRQLGETLGYKNVSTYINSGNLIFTTTKQENNVLAKQIESAIEATFGVQIPTLVYAKTQIKKIAKTIPWDWYNDANAKTDVLFLWPHYANNKTIKLIKHNPPIDTLKYVSGTIVWHVKKKHLAKSGLRKFIGTTVYKNMTARNVNTVRKLASLLDESK